MPTKARCIVNVKYIKKVEDVKERVKYVAFRTREHAEEELGLFNEQFDKGVNMEEFVADVKHDPALQHDATVKVHTMVLSFRQEDYDALQDKGINVKDITREFVKELEERKGMKLNWVAAAHHKEGHPHVHLIIKSVGTDHQDKHHRLRMDKDDFLWTRNKLDAIVDRYVPQQEAQRINDRQQHRLSQRLTQRPINHMQKLQSIHQMQNVGQSSSRMQRRATSRRQKRATTRQQQQQQAQQNLSNPNQQSQ
ncbi:relaxase/mobilization nuclease domain-containing protein [Alicyclobacillus fastidiosus]|uniref:relaxase/mobilization nuclease domain-containing protein n=1 Tax=Alicyclobacillus fastidiosus TaxID=392011 RepID=UPI0023EA47D0|nr:hypothetical protein [Alicyclobacillus fastidiosus]GMA66083.1 hypothetical protein GCM10025859_65250 [Alicyclobacillus fastidiosus]